MKQGNLNIRCTEDYAVLYWDKPAAAPSGAEYTVSLNGEAVGRTDRTHFTIEGLSYGSSFRVDVVSGSYCIGSATLQFGREKRRIDITAAPYFCKGDGHILNTDNLQRAINDCGADDILYVPAGDFLTGALRLHSDLEIYLAKGAVLQGTTNIHDYSPRIPSRFEGTEMRCYSSLLNAGDMNHKTGPNCRNIIIRGRGTICGGGQELARKIIEDERARIKSFLDDNRELVESCENSDTIPGRVRPRLINLSNCENVWISGVTLKNGPSWNVHMIYCNNIQTDHCVFESEGVWNGDGWDPDSSTNCTLFASEFHTGDDAVAIKSGKNPEGNEINRPCAHIRVFDCHSDCGHGICIGSEMSGGVKDMVVTQCLMDHTDRGLRVKTRRGRGNTAVIDGLVFRNVEMRGVKAPFVINMFYFCDPDGHGPYVQCREPMPVDEYTPKLGSLTMEDIVATDAQFAGCYFDGLPEQPIERVSMKNVTITFDPNAEAGQAAMADNRPLVKKLAIYAENVKEIDLHNVKIEGYEGERLHFANVGHFEED